MDIHADAESYPYLPYRPFPHFSVTKNKKSILLFVGFVALCEIFMVAAMPG